ncbi:MAG: SDR family NAD(P)-dependent oxidoreductase [Pseudorhodobacter sp.]
MTQNIALVTGATRGLGAALTQELASRGWHVVAVGRTTGALEELDDQCRAEKAPGALTLAPMDITQDDAMRHLCRSIHDRWGGLNLWAHCAIHAAPLSPAGHIDPKDLEKSLSCNLRATGGLIAMVEPLLRAGQGQAIFFDDPRGGEPFFGAYGASKAGQMALARSWAAETRRTGPQVRILTPNPMPTATRARFFPGEDRTPLTSARDEARRMVNSL